MATCGYDDDGVKTTSFPIIKDGMFVDYQTTREQAHLIGQKASHGCSYADNWSSIPFQRMPNVSLQPDEKEVSRAGHHRRDRRRHLRQGGLELQHRPPALQLPVQRPDLLGSQEREDHDAAARSRVSVEHAGVLEVARHARRAGDLSARGRVQRRQGSAGAEQLGQPRLPGRAVREGEHPEHESINRRGARPPPLPTRSDAHDLDTGTVEGAHRSGALLQQGRRDAGDAERRRSRQRAASRATASRPPARHPATAWRSRRRSARRAARSRHRSSATPAWRGPCAAPKRSPVSRRTIRRRCRSSGRRPIRRSRRIFDDAATASAGVARRLRAHRDRLEQAERRRVGGLRRDLGADAGGRDVEGAVRLRPVQRRRLQPHGAHAGRHRIRLGVALAQRAAAARSDRSSRPRRSTRPRDRAIPSPSSPANTPWSSSRRRSPICSSRWSLPRTRVRPTRGAASSRRRAAAPASASRSSVKRSGSIPIPRIPLAPAVPFDGAGPAAEEDRLGRRRGAEEPVVLALLGAEAGQGSDRAARQPDHGRRQRDDGRPDQGSRARNLRDAVLVYPLARSADAPGHRPDARRSVPDREGDDHASRSRTCAGTTARSSP